MRDPRKISDSATLIATLSRKLTLVADALEAPAPGTAAQAMDPEEYHARYCHYPTGDPKVVPTMKLARRALPVAATAAEVAVFVAPLALPACSPLAAPAVLARVALAGRVLAGAGVLLTAVERIRKEV